MMRIGMIMHTGFPPDIRVTKEVSTLQREHEIYLLCPRYPAQPEQEIIDGVTVRRVFTIWERWWAHGWLMAQCSARTWCNAIDKFIRQTEPNALHVHDLPLLGSAILVARQHGIPVVADLHEDYPALLESHFRTPVWQVRSAGALAARAFVDISRWRSYEARIVPEAECVVVVAEEAKERLVRLGVQPDRISVVPNYSTSAIGELYSDHVNEPDFKSDEFLLIYAGGFDSARDLKTVISAIGCLTKDEEIPGLKVLLVGGTDQSVYALQKHAAAVGVSRYVSISPWVTQHEAEQMMSRTHVGLVPHVKSPHTDTTIPHKIFQYMSRKLPVIASDCTPLQRIVTESKCGLIYEHGNPNSLAECIMQLYLDRDAARSMGISGYKSVMSKYNWENAGDTLLQAYRRLAPSEMEL